jgi:hypothetical protein
LGKSGFQTSIGLLESASFLHGNLPGACGS